MEPQISVIIPAFNSARYVAEAIDSALAQTLPPMEVIVVDDGSTDDTEEVLRPYQDRIRYFRQPNGGSAAARNQGIREARGDLIAFLDADDVWLPGKLEKQWDCLREHPAAGLVHTNFFYCDENGNERVPGVLGRERVGRCYEKLFLANGLNTCTMLIRRECLERVGPFDQSFRTCQDYDLFLRIAKHYEFAYVDEPLALYRQHGSNTSRANLLMRTNDLRVVRKLLSDDPELPRLVGPRRVRRRLHNLLFSIGYIHHDDHRQAEARRFFLEALSHQPWRVYTLSLYLANLLPASWTRALRQLKAVLTRQNHANGPRGARAN